MNRLQRNIALLILASLVWSAGEAQAKDKLNVMVSIFPQAFLAEQVGGHKISVSVMIPPSGNPHTYEPTPGQIRTLSEADVYLTVGSHLEFEKQWLGKLTALNKDMLLVNTVRDIALLASEGGCGNAHHHHHHHHHTGKDPHVWLSPANAIVMAAHIRDGLIKADPRNEEYYRQNAATLILALSALREEIKETLAGLENRTFMVFHPAWGYFADEFGLTQIAAEYEGKDLTPRQLVRVIKKAREVNARVVFASPQFSGKTVRVIADEIGARVETLDPLAKDYMENLRAAADLLAGRSP